MTMEKLPKADMVLAGFLAQVSLTWIIRIATETGWVAWWYTSEICRLNGIPWLLLILISAGVTVLTILKSEGDKVFQGIVTFVSSFLLNCGGAGLGLMAINCSIGWSHLVTKTLYVSLVVMAIACLGLIAHLIKSTPQSIVLPDPEVILLGICAQLAAWYCIEVSQVKNGYSIKESDSEHTSYKVYTTPYPESEHTRDSLCKTGGVGSWLLLLALSCIPSIFTAIKTAENFRLSRLFRTFIGTFLLFLLQDGVGFYAVACASNFEISYLGTSPRKAYGCVCIVINALLALAFTLGFIKKQRASTNPDPVPQNAVFVDPNATSYLLQDIRPQDHDCNNKQTSYPPPDSYPPPVSYPPPEPYPPQVSYPPEASYPQEASSLQ